jgi:hypothetical protein
LEFVDAFFQLAYLGFVAVHFERLVSQGLKLVGVNVCESSLLLQFAILVAQLVYLLLDIVDLVLE